MRFVTIVAWALLALAGCAKEDASSDGNGPNTPAARDAAPGPLSETEPPSTPAPAPTDDRAPADPNR